MLMKKSFSNGGGRAWRYVVVRVAVDAKSMSSTRAAVSADVLSPTAGRGGHDYETERQGEGREEAFSDGHLRSMAFCPSKSVPRAACW